MLGPSTAIWLRKMIVPHIPGGRAPLGSGLGATSPYAGVTIAILGDYRILEGLYVLDLCIVHLDPTPGYVLQRFVRCRSLRSFRGLDLATSYKNSETSPLRACIRS